MQLAPVPQHERGQLVARNGRKMQAHILVAAILFDRVQRAADRFFISLRRNGIIKIFLFDISVAQNQTPLRFGIMGVEILPPHKGGAGRIVGKTRRLRVHHRQKAEDVFLFQFLELHKVLFYTVFSALYHIFPGKATDFGGCAAKKGSRLRR